MNRIKLFFILRAIDKEIVKLKEKFVGKYYIGNRLDQYCGMITDISYEPSYDKKGIHLYLNFSGSRDSLYYTFNETLEDINLNVVDKDISESVEHFRKLKQDYYEKYKSYNALFDIPDFTDVCSLPKVINNDNIDSVITTIDSFSIEKIFTGLSLERYGTENYQHVYEEQLIKRRELFAAIAMLKYDKDKMAVDYPIKIGDIIRHGPYSYYLVSVKEFSDVSYIDHSIVLMNVDTKKLISPKTLMGYSLPNIRFPLITDVSGLSQILHSSQ